MSTVASWRDYSDWCSEKQIKGTAISEDWTIRMLQATWTLQRVQRSFAKKKVWLWTRAESKRETDTDTAAESWGWDCLLFQCCPGGLARTLIPLNKRGRGKEGRFRDMFVDLSLESCHVIFCCLFLFCFALFSVKWKVHPMERYWFIEWYKCEK